MRDIKRPKSGSASGAEAERSRRPHHTKLEIVLLLALLAAVSGCNENSPTAPQDVSPPDVSPPVDASGHIYGTVFILGSGGKCLTGATIEVLDGPAAGKRVQQSSDQCVNDGSGLDPSYRLTGLPMGRQVRIRASAPGYWSQERLVQPQPGGIVAYEFEVDFELLKSPDLSLGFVYGTVWGPDGCLTGARVDVLDGPAAGKGFVQSATDCLNNDGSGNSYFLTDLPPGTPIRIRASMPGYQSQEQSVEPRPDTARAANSAVDFSLIKSP